MKNLRLKELRRLDQDYRPSNWSNQDSNPWLADIKVSDTRVGRKTYSTVMQSAVMYSIAQKCLAPWWAAPRCILPRCILPRCMVLGCVVPRWIMGQEQSRKSCLKFSAAAAKLLSRVQLLATPWTVAYQAPPPTGFSRREYWSGVPLPSPSVLY